MIGVMVAPGWGRVQGAGAGVADVLEGGVRVVEARGDVLQVPRQQMGRPAEENEKQTDKTTNQSRDIKRHLSHMTQCTMARRWCVQVIAGGLVSDIVL